LPSLGPFRISLTGAAEISDHHRPGIRHGKEGDAIDREIDVVPEEQEQGEGDPVKAPTMTTKMTLRFSPAQICSAPADPVSMDGRSITATTSNRETTVIRGSSH
jgi:hypothetical protein